MRSTMVCAVISGLAMSMAGWAGPFTFWGDLYEPSNETHYHLGTAGGTTSNWYDYRFTAPKTGTVNGLAMDIFTYTLGDWQTTNWTVQFRADSGGLPGTVIRQKTQTGAQWFQGWAGKPNFFSNWPELSDSVVAGQVYHMTLIPAETVTYPTPWKDCEPGYLTNSAVGNGGTPTMYMRTTDGVTDANQATLTSDNSGANWTVRNPAWYGVRYSDGSLYGSGAYNIATHNQWRVFGANNFSGQYFQFTGVNPEGIHSAGVKLMTVGSPAGVAYLTLYDVTAASNVFANLPLSGVTSSMNWRDTLLSSQVYLQPGHYYRYYLTSPGSADQNNSYQPGFLDVGAGGAQPDLSFQSQFGYGIISTNGGGSWATYPTWLDLQFRLEIPEPTAALLLGLPAAACLLRRRPKTRC